jgi:hypothetical protein
MDDKYKQTSYSGIDSLDNNKSPSNDITRNSIDDIIEMKLNIITKSIQNKRKGLDIPLDCDIIIHYYTNDKSIRRIIKRYYEDIKKTVRAYQLVPSRSVFTSRSKTSIADLEFVFSITPIHKNLLLNWRFKVIDFSDYNDNIVFYQNHSLIKLNEDTSYIWRLLDRGCTTRDIIEEVKNQHPELDVTYIETEVISFIHDMLSKECMEIRIDEKP